MEYTEANRLKWLKMVKLDSPPFLDVKKRQLSELIRKNAHLPDQGTDEWLAVRRFSIGGSEIAVITRDNRFSNIKKLIAGKVGLVQFQGRLATRWGKMFENVTTLMMEQILQIEGKIQETSSLEGAIFGQRYSPDGLAVVKMLCGDIIDGEYIERWEYLTVLFEFKSPYSSIPKGEIPAYYIPQVLTGLCSIPIADLAIFVNNMYRKCSLSHFDLTARYDTFFHNKDEGKVVVGEPIMLGFIFVYFKPETRKNFEDKYQQDLDDSDSEESEEEFIDKIDYEQMTSHYPKSDDRLLIETLLTSSKPKDFGNSNYHEFDKLMSLFDEGLIDLHYCEPLVIQKNVNQIEFMQSQFTPREQDIEDEIEKYKNKIQEFSGLVGYIPYKLFKSDMIVKHRDPDYLKKYESDVDDTIKKIKDIVGDDLQNKDLNDINTRFRKHFPNRDDWIDKEIASNLESYMLTQARPDMIPRF